MTRRFIKNITASLLFVLWAAAAFAQGTVLQSGPIVKGHLSTWASNGVLKDGGPASGGVAGVGITELLQVSPASPAAGTGPYGTHSCFRDGPLTGPFHYLCLDANALNSHLFVMGAVGGAADLPVVFRICANSGTCTDYQLPFIAPGTGVIGPSTTTINEFVVWNNTTGTLVKDGAGASIAHTGDLAVTGTVTVDGPLNVTGNTALDGVLALQGLATLAGGIDVTAGGAAISGGLAVIGNTTISGGTLTTSGLLTANGGITVTGATTLGNTQVNGTLGVTGATTLDSTLGVTGATTLGSTLDVTGATTLANGLSVTSGTSAFAGPVNIGNALTVTGTTELGVTNVNGLTTFDAQIYVAGGIITSCVNFDSLPLGPVAGTIECVLNSSVNTWGGTADGAGALTVLVWYTGTIWTVIGQ